MLRIRPSTIKTANAFVAKLHRHHKPVHGALWAASVFDDERCETVGVAIVGRPVSRMLDDGMTAEVTRLATDGTRNACSALYGACARAAKALGYRRIITYTLASEPGTSLVASGWVVSLANAGGGSWSSPSRPRIDTAPTEPKTRWERTLA